LHFSFYILHSKYIVTLFLYSILFLASVVITLGGCTLFTNGIEWLGKRLKVPEGAVGSVFAAVGTTLPETSIPVVAIFFGEGQERTDVGLGAILGAPFMLSTLVLPILAGLLLLYARLGARPPAFKVDYREVQFDLQFFLIAYGLAVGMAFVPSRPAHYVLALVLLVLYGYYVYSKLGGRPGAGVAIDPLILSRRASTPSYGIIGLQSAIGLVGLATGAHLFVSAATAMAAELSVPPLVLALLIAPLATELPEMSNSFLWLYKRKDTLAVGNVTGAMVFQGTFPVSVGLIGTNWELAPAALATMALALLAVGLSLGQLVWGGHWRPWLLGGGAVLYLGYGLYLYVF
jgi:cation:H+ antiporter